MSVKIQPTRSDSLCATCEHATIMERRSGETKIHCSEINRFVPGDIVKCKDHQAVNTISKWEMEKIAWELRTDKSGKILGFTPPKKTE